MVGQAGRQILREFLIRTKAVDETELSSLTAGGRAVPPASAEDRDWLYQRLVERASQNRQLLKLLIAAHFIVLLTALCLIYVLRDKPEFVQLISGSSFVALMPIVYNLGKLWRWTTTFETLLAVFPLLPPQEAVKAILALYFDKGQSAVAALNRGAGNTAMASGNADA